MKTSKIITILISGVLICATTSFAQGCPDGKHPCKGKEKGEHHKKMLEKFDKDGDGKLNKDEKKSAREARKERREENKAKMLEKFDTNNDGKLNKEERKAAHKEIKAQRKEIHEAVLEKFDTNKDGELNKDEREGVREWVKENYPDAIHPPRRGGPHNKKGKGKREQRR